MNDKKCIIVCAGEFDPISIEKQEGDLLIAADGGYGYCESMGLLQDLIVGDFDSLPEHQKKNVDEIRAEDPERVVSLPCEKDDTDTLAAIKEGLKRGYKKFYFYAAMGGRLDHTLANIQSLLFLKQHGAKGYLMELNQMVTVLQNEETRFHPSLKGGLSVFCLGEKAKGVALKGLKYELEDAELTNSFPIGISNELIGKEAVVSVKEGCLLLLVRWE